MGGAIKMLDPVGDELSHHRHRAQLRCRLLNLGREVIVRPVLTIGFGEYLVDLRLCQQQWTAMAAAIGDLEWSIALLLEVMECLTHDESPLNQADFVPFEEEKRLILVDPRDLCMEAAEPSGFAGQEDVVVGSAETIEKGRIHVVPRGF